MTSRIGTAAVAIAMLTIVSAGASIAGPATIYLEGLIVAAIDPVDDETSREARLLLVRMQIDRSKNKVAHVPAMSIPEKFIKGCPGETCTIPRPSEIFEKDGLVVYMWYLHDTLVENDSSASGNVVKLEKPEQIPTPNVCEKNKKHKKLERLDDDLWDGVDADERVAGRIPLRGGTLGALDPKHDVSNCDGASTMGLGIKWTGNLSTIKLSRLDGSDPQPDIELESDAVVSITNYPSRASGAANVAHHFREYYELTDKFFKPDWKERAAPERPLDQYNAKVRTGVEGTFCPPTTLKKKGG